MKLSERDAQNRSITSTGLTPLKSSVTFARVAVSTVRTSTTFDALLHCTAGPAHRRSQTSFSEFDLKSPWHFKAKSLVWSFCFDLFSYLLDRTFREGYRSGTRTSLPVPPRERQPNETIQFSSVQSLDWLGRRGEGGERHGGLQQRSSSSLFCKRPLWAALAWAGMSSLWPCPYSISSCSIPLDEREHWFSSKTQLSLMAPRPFLSHTLVTTSAGGWKLVRGC